MLVLRTRIGWRLALWAIAIADAVMLSFALAAGDGGGIALYGISAALFLLLALQSRSTVQFDADGVIDRRVMLRRAWRWEDVDRVLVRSGGLVRAPLVVVGPQGTPPLQLNPRLLHAVRDDLNVPPMSIPDGVVSLAQVAGVTVEDHR